MPDNTASLKNNAEKCIALAESNLVPSPAYDNYYKFIIDYLFEGLEEADIIYDNAFDYALSK